MKDAAGNVQRILVLGGTSEIAVAVVRALTRHRRGVRVTLAARAGDRRTAAAAALRDGGAEVCEVDFEARDPLSRALVVAGELDDADGLDDVDAAVVAFGVLGDQEHAWQQRDRARELVEVNYAAAVDCGVMLADRLRRQGHGAIVALSSVAGELPRRSNVVYGSTKAGMDAFYRGLGEAVAADGVHVLVVRPGFVTSRMTAGLRPAPLAQTPDQVARAVVDGLHRRAQVVWVPSSMRWVMVVLRHTPRWLLRRLPV